MNTDPRTDLRTEPTGRVTAPLAAGSPRELDLELSPAFLRRYQPMHDLGRGGMGVVLAAEDRLFQRTVAVKFLLSTHEPDAIARFQREAKLLAGITHPNVVAILDLAEMEGRPYLVSEYLEGGTLRARMNASPIALEDAVAIALDCLSGLEAIHATGVVHRDVKPENVLFARDGTAKMADLGIAKPIGPATQMTATGAFLGTPLYASPEQIEDRPVTFASDLYAMGLILFELIARRKPFDVSTPYEILHCHAEVPAPHLSDVVAGLPRALTTLVASSLEKDPARRPLSARAFADALRACPLAGSMPVVRPEPLRPHRRRRGALGLIAGLALVALAVSARVTLRPRHDPNAAAAYLSHGENLFALGKLEEAETAIRRATELAPENASAHLAFGILLLNRADDASAWRELEQALRQSPDSPMVQTQVGFLFARAGVLARAEAHLRRGIELDPKLAEPKRFLEQMQTMVKGMKAAELTQRAAIAKDANSAAAHHALARALGGQGRWAEADAAYRRARELDPANASYANDHQVMLARRAFAALLDRAD